MKMQEIKAALDKIGLPVAYRSFPENQAPALPYMCYYVSGSRNFAADGKVYEKINQVQIELYTDRKEELVEEKVEEVLDTLAVWEKTETYLDTEKCYQILYEIEV